MFIFDSGRINKAIAGTRREKCSHCGEECPHELTEVSFCATVMEVPLIPYRKRHVLVCTRCGGGRELSRQEFDNLKASCREEKERHRPAYEYEKTRQEGMKFCRHCGERIKQDAGFCNHCGKTAADGR
jgi:hypothetical protein